MTEGVSCGLNSPSHGCAVTEGVTPQRRAFAESGAATAVFRYDPTREKVAQKRPQAFLSHKL